MRTEGVEDLAARLLVAGQEPKPMEHLFGVGHVHTLGDLLEGSRRQKKLVRSCPAINALYPVMGNSLILLRYKGRIAIPLKIVPERFDNARFFPIGSLPALLQPPLEDLLHRVTSVAFFPRKNFERNGKLAGSRDQSHNGVQPV